MAKTKGGGKQHSTDPVEEETDGIQKMRGKGKSLETMNRLAERAITASNRREANKKKKNRRSTRPLSLFPRLGFPYVMIDLHPPLGLLEFPPF